MLPLLPHLLYFELQIRKVPPSVTDVGRLGGRCDLGPGEKPEDQFAAFIAEQVPSVRCIALGVNDLSTRTLCPGEAVPSQAELQYWEASITGNVRAVRSISLAQGKWMRYYFMPPSDVDHKM